MTARIRERQIGGVEFAEKMRGRGFGFCFWKLGKEGYCICRVFFFCILKFCCII